MVAPLYGSGLGEEQPLGALLCGETCLKRREPQPATQADAAAAEQKHQQQQDHQQQEPARVLRVLDLYSGIGGMHHALLRLLPLLDAHESGCGLEDGREGQQPQPRPQQQQRAEGQPGRGSSSGGGGRLGVGRDARYGTLRLEVTAVDINTTANRVYASEFGVQPLTLDLQRVTAAQLDNLAANLWLLTPPCQPYTNAPNARRRDTADPRAASLLHLLSGAVLPSMRRPPARLLLENVPGFVGSGSHTALRGTLAAAGYELQEFVVSPHQLGVPYSRPRYFALAVRRPLRFPRQYDCSTGPIEHPPALGPASGLPPPLGVTAPPQGSRCAAASAYAGAAGTADSCAGHDDGVGVAVTWPGVYNAGPIAEDAACAASGSALPLPLYEGAQAMAAAARPPPRPPTLAQFLLSAAPAGNDASHLTSSEPSAEPTCAAGGGDAGDGGGADPWVAYAVPAAQLARFWRVLDVVTPVSTYCNCFTKHYTNNVLGAGSVLASREFAGRFCVRDARGRLHFAAPPVLLPGAVAPGSGGDAVTAGRDEPAGEVPIVWRRRPRGGGGGRRSGLGHGSVVSITDSEAAAPVCPDSPPRSQQQTQERHRPFDNPQQQQQDNVDDGAEAVVNGLRFFTPAEVAAIHGLPANWVARAGAAGVQPRQQYSLLGNGLSTDVAAYLLRYLFEARRVVADA